MWWEALTNQVGHRKPHPVRLCKGVQEDNLSARGARGGGGNSRFFKGMMGRKLELFCKLGCCNHVVCLRFLTTANQITQRARGARGHKGCARGVQPLFTLRIHLLIGYYYGAFSCVLLSLVGQRLEGALLVAFGYHCFPLPTLPTPLGWLITRDTIFERTEDNCDPYEPASGILLLSHELLRPKYFSIMYFYVISQCNNVQICNHEFYLIDKQK